MAHKPLAFVTGASTGIGRAIAVDLVKQGYDVFGSVRREADGESLQAEGVRALMLDVTKLDMVERARDIIADHTGDRPLDVLVNNAGIAVIGPWEYISAEELKHQFDVNVLGVAAVTRTFLSQLRETRGRIVMMSSVSGRIAAPFVGPYASSKFALEAMSDSMRRELRPHGVEVVCIEPGPIDTPIWGKFRETYRNKFKNTVYEDKLEPAMQRAERTERKALPVEAVCRAVRKAITQPVPPARMVVMRGSSMYRLLAVLPDSIKDRIMAGKRVGKRAQRKKSPTSDDVPEGSGTLV